jgi:hypothetical protein
MFYVVVCSDGSYGYNCNQSCDGCLSDFCDKEHGVCTDTSGCKPGWQHGQTKCDLRMFKKWLIITSEQKTDECMNYKFVLC